MHIRYKLFPLLLILLILFAGYGCAEEDTWICPNCAEENSGNFCSNCGFKRPPAATEQEDSTWKCQICGTEIFY